jgi:hypothetical protein
VGGKRGEGPVGINLGVRGFMDFLVWESVGGLWVMWEVRNTCWGRLCRWMEDVGSLLDVTVR